MVACEPLRVNSIVLEEITEKTILSLYVPLPFVQTMRKHPLARSTFEYHSHLSQPLLHNKTCIFAPYLNFFSTQNSILSVSRAFSKTSSFPQSIQWPPLSHFQNLGTRNSEKIGPESLTGRSNRFIVQVALL